MPFFSKNKELPSVSQPRRSVYRPYQIRSRSTKIRRHPVSAGLRMGDVSSYPLPNFHSNKAPAPALGWIDVRRLSTPLLEGLIGSFLSYVRDLRISG